jgi:hypothetical protein
MPQDDNSSKSSKTQISIHEAACRLLKICPRRIAKPTMERKLIDGQIHVAHTGPIKHHDPKDDPPLNIFQLDLHGSMQIWPGFPGPKNTVRRRVSARSPPPSYWIII